jgi:AcrR family transcriptional regulator
MEDTVKTQGRPAGRPRDEEATPALLHVTRRLVGEKGFEDVTIASIAAAAGVGRQTIYRRWSSKAELVLDAFLDSASHQEVVADGPVAQVLERFLVNLFENIRRDGPAIRNLIASAQTDDSFMQIFRKRFVLPRAQVAVAIIQRGIARGELSSGIDLEMTVDALHGVFWYRLLQSRPLDDTVAARLSLFLTGSKD